MHGIVLLLVCSCTVLCQEKLEFEVVSVKPSAPPDPRGVTMGCHGGPGSDDPTLLVCQNLALADLVGRAYGLNYYELSAPDWMHQTRYDVRARVSAGTSREQIAEMWRSMLVDRFHIAVHRETRDFRSFDLLLAKGGPKFKTRNASIADSPGEDSGLKLDERGYPKVGPGHSGMANARGLSRMYYPSCTMGWLAGALSGQMGGPVTDATGLKGEYEIGMYWAADSLAESSPDIGPTLVQALRDQLGLRLESKKSPLEMLIVDHCERVPSDN
jgi:uncharacterized protein (TIGR03435 family)